MKKSGLIVYLRASIPTLVKRLSADKDRPLLKTEEGLEKRLISLMKIREPIYGKVASFAVDVDDRTPEEIANEIIGHVRGEK